MTTTANVRATFEVLAPEAAALWLIDHLMAERPHRRLLSLPYELRWVGALAIPPAWVAPTLAYVRETAPDLLGGDTAAPPAAGVPRDELDRVQAALAAAGRPTRLQAAWGPSGLTETRGDAQGLPARDEAAWLCRTAAGQWLLLTETPGRQDSPVVESVADRPPAADGTA